MYFLTLLLALLPSLFAQPDRFGLPACSAPDLELALRSSFILCHSSSLRVPIWTIYELKPAQLTGAFPRPKHFRHDRGLTGARAYDSDYRNSGLTRGHMVPALDLAWSEDAIRDTFLLSNAVPQYAAMNNGKWRMLENRIRTLAASSEALYVFTGPIFQGEIESIGTGNVAVPTQLYKVVLALRDAHKIMYAAIVPNSPAVPGPLRNYLVPVQEVERRTGLTFFSALNHSEQQRLKSTHSDFPVPVNNQGSEEEVASPPTSRCGLAR